MKKIRLLLILLIFFPTLVSASTNTKSREGVVNYGVTKFEIDNSKKKYVLNTPYVDESEKIYDFSEIFSEEDEEKILEEIKEFRSKTDFDLVILTQDYEYNSDDDNENYASDFYDFNNFDRNGIVFFRNTYSTDPYYGLYSFGDAQLYYYDDSIDSILDEIYDNIHSEYYYEGIHQLISLLEEHYDEGKLEGYFVDKDGMLRDGSKYYVDEKGKLQKKHNFLAPIVPSFFISIIITTITISSMVKKNKMVRLATDAAIYTNHESINMAVNKDELVNSVTNRTYIPPASSSSGGGGGHSSSIGHSGGGHSGGGRHG